VLGIAEGKYRAGGGHQPVAQAIWGRGNPNNLPRHVGAVRRLELAGITEGHHLAGGAGEPVTPPGCGGGDADYSLAGTSTGPPVKTGATGCENSPVGTREPVTTARRGRRDPDDLRFKGPWSRASSLTGITKAKNIAIG
jgi:hypothetical protein